MKKYRSRSGRGFTLVELLVVVGIIGVLVSILVPVVGKMRQAGYKTDTANQLNVIRSAVEMYHQTFQAYPGPFADDEVFSNKKLVEWITGGRPTMAENLVLGLIGGIEQTKNKALPVFHQDMVGIGPRSLNLSNPKRYEPFLSNHAGMLSAGLFRDNTGRTVCADTEIPEFVDRFPSEPMPILYLRARRGAIGIIGDKGNPPLQYDLRAILPYTSANIHGKVQGLRELGNVVAGNQFTRLQPVPEPNPALPYFVNRQLPPASLSNENQVRMTGTPRSKDGFILISAGQDRIYGTLDDITSFGSVAE